MINSIQWLFLDLGGTLIDEAATEEYRAGQIQKLANERGIEISIDSIKRMVGQAAASFRHDIIAGAIEGIIGNPAEAAALSKSIGYMHEYESPYPCAVKILPVLSAKFKIGIVANQKTGAEERLRRYGFLEYISFIVSSAEAGVSKPNLAIFRLALEKAGCKPQNAIMVGDRLDNDIKPAKALGLGTIWIRQGYHGLAEPRDGQERPTYTISCIDELPGVFGL